MAANWAACCWFERRLSWRGLLAGMLLWWSGQALPGSATSLYEAMIQKVAQEERVDPSLLRAVVATESDFDPNAVSPKGAMGLMQLMPGTARLMGVTQPFHPEDNLRGGARYLRSLMDRFNRVDYALAGYNAGPENIDKYNGIPPFPETQDYVAKVQAKLQPGSLAMPVRRWWPPPAATLPAPIAPGTSLPKFVAPPKKIFVYRDAKGTLVLTDVQPRIQAQDPVKISPPGTTSLGQALTVRRPSGSIRISPPVRVIRNQRKELPG